MPRPRKSISLHQAQGTYRADRHRELPLRPTKGPRPPAWLSGPARQKWREAARLLASAGVLSRLDHDLLAVYCSTWAAWRQAAEAVATEGATYRAGGGLLKKHPAVGVAEAARKDLAGLADRLGLTPAARLKLGVMLPDDRADGPGEFRGRGGVMSRRR
jgi:P27 family predicted phage terminase small subunit